MTKKKWLIIAGFGIVLGLGLLPLFPDPFHQKTENVCFWEWLAKELWEMIHGEEEVQD